MVACSVPSKVGADRRISAAAVISRRNPPAPVIGAVAGIDVGAPHLLPSHRLGRRCLARLRCGGCAIPRRTPCARSRDRLRTHQGRPAGICRVASQDHDVTDADRALCRAASRRYELCVPRRHPMRRTHGEDRSRRSTAWMWSTPTTTASSESRRSSPPLASEPRWRRRCAPRRPAQPRTADAPVVKAAAASADSLTPYCPSPPPRQDRAMWPTSTSRGSDRSSGHTQQSRTICVTYNSRQRVCDGSDDPADCPLSVT